MHKMTIRQIAEAAGCNHKTVRDEAARLYPDRARNGIRQEFDAHESFTIMAALPKRNMIGPSQNREAHLPEIGKLPCGAQLRELRMIYGASEAQKRIDFAIGYHAAIPEQRQIADMTPHGLSRQAWAVQRKVEAKIEEQKMADKLNGHLFGDN